MKLIIDISQNDYEEIKKYGINTFPSVAIAIQNGKPLPKEYGDLIDRKALINNGIQKGFCDWYDEIKYAPTIVKAELKGE